MNNIKLLYKEAKQHFDKLYLNLFNDLDIYSNKFTLKIDPDANNDLFIFYEKHGFIRKYWGVHPYYELPNYFINIIDENGRGVVSNIEKIRDNMLRENVKKFADQHQYKYIIRYPYMEWGWIKITFFANDHEMYKEIDKANHEYEMYNNKSRCYKFFHKPHIKIKTGYYHYPDDIKLREVSMCPKCHNMSLYYKWYRNFNNCDFCGYDTTN